MRNALLPIFLVLAFSTQPLGAAAWAETIEVTVTYRERIALPPDAELDVQLLDISPGDAVARRLSSQRFAMMTVPMTVTLAYDPQLAKDRESHVVVADIWSGGERLFRTTDRHEVLGAEGADNV